MYFDYSLRKILTVVLVFSVLLILVGFMFVYKESRYGQTPFFPSIGFFAQENMANAAFALDSILEDGITLVGRGLAAIGISGVGQVQAAPSGPAQAIPVLTYHRIVDSDDGSNVNVHNFEDQMRKLYDAGWRTVTMADFEAFMAGKKTLPEKSFLITFDDGAKGSYYPVDPVLRHYGFSAVEYVIVKASETPESVYYLAPEEIRRMVASGRWEIGSHSFDGHHPYPVDAVGTQGNFFADRLWNSVSGRPETSEEFGQRVYADLLSAKQSLEQTYGVAVSTFAFPFGEVGVITAENFPEGVSISNEEAAKIYDYGFLQTHGEDFSFNYPQYRNFLAKRIHVDHDWDGSRLLRVLENGNPKQLPFEDDMSVDRGWIPSWGSIQAGTILSLTSDPKASSASTILDGTLLWKHYEYTINADWTTGYTLALTNVQNARSYRACAYSEGKVRLQTVEDGNTVILGQAVDPAITRGNGVVFGARVEGNSVSCLWGSKVVLTVNGLKDINGGIGIQTWDPDVGTSHLVVHHVSVVGL